MKNKVIKLICLYFQQQNYNHPVYFTLINSIDLVEK